MSLIARVSVTGSVFNEITTNISVLLEKQFR